MTEHVHPDATQITCPETGCESSIAVFGDATIEHHEDGSHTVSYDTPTPSLEDQITAEGIEIARRALGIPDHANVVPFDLHAQPLVVIVRESGAVDLWATIPRADAVNYLRSIADSLEAKA